MSFHGLWSHPRLSWWPGVHAPSLDCCAGSVGVSRGTEARGDDGASPSLDNHGAGRRSVSRYTGGEGRFYTELYRSNTRNRYCFLKISGDGRSSLALDDSGTRAGILARGLAATIAVMFLPFAPSPTRGSGISPLPAMAPMVHYARVVAQRRGIGKHLSFIKSGCCPSRRPLRIIW